jgi:mono/diheme cytochrome c family protein
MRYWLRCSIILIVLAAAGSSTTYLRSAAAQDTLPPDFIPSGKDMFKQYCAPCHGLNAKGHGPARSALKVPAADLTTLSKRHGGEFPYDYVSNVLRFGPGIAAHGSSDMPTWGSIFQYMDNYNRASVEKRIKNLCAYLAAIQE